MGYHNGIIILVDPYQSDILLYFNYNYDIKDINIKRTKVKFLLIVPGTNNEEFIAVFSDSVIIQFNLYTKTYDEEFLQYIERLEEHNYFTRYSSNQIKKEATFTSAYYQYVPHELSLIFAKAHPNQK